jgi:arylsulfatase A-like enzyme
LNILLLTADQWRGDCLSALGHSCVRTPVLDRLAADGVLFRRHYSQATPCGPARASIHTGLYALNHRSVTNGTPLDARHKTSAQLARQAGWDPVLFGYTDTSIDPRTVPADDPALRTYESVAPGWRAELHLPEDARAWLDYLGERGYGRLTLDDVYGTRLGAPALFRAEDSETAFVTDRFLAWLARQRGPWFAHVSWLRPHPPLLAAEPWNSLIDVSDVPPPRRARRLKSEAALHPWLAVHLEQPWPKARPPGHPAGPWELDGRTVATLRRIHFGLIAEVDHHLGRILDALARREVLDDTLVLFTADHGEMLGDHWMLGKSGFFPEAFHVPLIVRDPRPGRARGHRVDAFTEHVDLMPTILEALDVAVPLQCDGRSLGAFLAGGEAEGWRRAAHFEHDFRDLETLAYERALALASDDCALNVRLGERFAYVHFSGLPALCFDSAADPGWTRNLAAEPDAAPIVLAQAQALLSWRMRAAERRLTAAKLTPAGLIGRYDPA